MNNIPKVIYLQVGEDTLENEDFNELSTTWCTEKINDIDIEYVLKDDNNAQNSQTE